MLHRRAALLGIDYVALPLLLPLIAATPPCHTPYVDAMPTCRYYAAYDAAAAATRATLIRAVAYFATLTQYV